MVQQHSVKVVSLKGACKGSVLTRIKYFCPDPAKPAGVWVELGLLQQVE